LRPTTYHLVTVGVLSLAVAAGLVALQAPATVALKANGKIAFDSDRDGAQAHIFTINPDGTGTY
jgi:hypothetical protein